MISIENKLPDLNAIMHFNNLTHAEMFSHIIRVEPKKIKEFCIANKGEIVKTENHSGFTIIVSVKKNKTVPKMKQVKDKKGVITNVKIGETVSIEIKNYPVYVYSHNNNVLWWNRTSIESIILASKTQKILNIIIKLFENKMPEIKTRLRFQLN